jgi:hypothetical protein
MGVEASTLCGLVLALLLALAVLGVYPAFEGLFAFDTLEEEVDGLIAVEAAEEDEDGDPDDALLANLLSLLLFMLYALLAASLAGGVGGGLLLLFDKDDAVAAGGVLCRLRCASTLRLGLLSCVFVAVAPVIIGCCCWLFSRVCAGVGVSAPSIDESIL